jgi:hypothetical protein
MFQKVTTLAGLALCLSLPALAQQTTQASLSNSTSTMGTPTQGMNSASIRNHLMQDLEKAGYTDVKIVPASFVAQAKDKQGHPVTMLISPDSITTITEVPQMKTSMNNGSSSTTTTGGTGSSTSSR